MIEYTPKVFTFVPAYGQMMTAQTASSLLSTQRLLIQNNLDGGFGTLSYPDIVEIRNIALSLWYDRIQTSHMLFYDADMSNSSDLIMDMIRFNRPLVGALCPKKKLPIEFAGRAQMGDVPVVDGFMKVAGIGGAIMLISREVVTAMLAREPELSDTVTVKNHAAKGILEGQGVTRLIKAFNKVSIDGEEFSEDLSFCHRWTACGGEIWANIMHPVTHVGMYEYQGRYYDHIKDHIRGVNDPPLPPVGEVEQPSVAPEIAHMVAA